MLKQGIKAILASSLLLIGGSGLAQTESSMPIYKLAAGLRVGDYHTGTVKYFFSDLMAVEGSIGFSFLGMPKMSVFVEKFHEDMFMPNFHLFYGAGLNFRARREWVYDNSYGYSYNGRYETRYFVGPSIIGGVEYDFSEMLNFPVAASADVRLGLDFPSAFFYPSPGVAVRYILK